MCDQSKKFVNNLPGIDSQWNRLSINKGKMIIFALTLWIVYRVEIAFYFTHVIIDPFFMTYTKRAVPSEFSRRGKAQLDMNEWAQIDNCQ